MGRVFSSFKEKLVTSPVVGFLDFDLSFIVETNASFISLGAVLAQKKADGKVHPLQLASRTMAGAKKKYCTYKTEKLAKIFALEKYYFLLFFTLITDHQALYYTFQ